MANLAQFDLRAKGRESRIRGLLEDLVQAHVGVRPQYRLALAVWFRKSPTSDDQHLLELMTGLPTEGFVQDRLSLLWQTGSEGAPFADVRVASVDFFAKLLAYPDQVAGYREACEVLYFDKKLLIPEILELFGIVTEPAGLMKGWYISAREFADSKGAGSRLPRYSGAKPELGLVKTGESTDFEYCHGILHVERDQKWLPLSPEGIRSYNYYNDQMTESSGYFLFEGGSLYRILKFEVKTAPEYAGKLLGRTPDDRYPQVYLRAVHPSSQPSA